MAKVKMPKIMIEWLAETGYAGNDTEGEYLREAKRLQAAIWSGREPWASKHPSSKRGVGTYISKLEAAGVVEEKGKPDQIDVVIIDVEAGSIFAQTIRNDLQEFYRTIGCDCIDVAVRAFDGQIVDCIVDDEGPLKGGAIVSVVDRNGAPQLVGNVIFTGYDLHGNTVSLTEEQKNAILSSVGVAQYSDGQMRMIAQCDTIE